MISKLLISQWVRGGISQVNLTRQFNRNKGGLNYLLASVLSVGVSLKSQEGSKTESEGLKKEAGRSYRLSKEQDALLFGQISSDKSVNNVRARHLAFKQLSEVRNCAEAIPLGPAGISDGPKVGSGYKSPNGQLEIRTLISAHFKNNINISCESKDVIITEGSINGLHMLTQVLALKGNGEDMSILTLKPTFMPQGQTINLASCGKVEMDAHPNPRTLLQKVNNGTKAILLTVPPNPPIPDFTFTTEYLKTVSEYCEGRGIDLWIDATYMEYDSKTYPLLKTVWDHCSRAVIITSTSKIKNPEPHVGFMVTKDAELMSNLIQNRVASTCFVSELSQLAIPDTLNNLTQLKANIDKVMIPNRKLWEASRLTVYMDRGSPYVLVHIDQDSATFAKDMLTRYGIIIERADVFFNTTNDVPYIRVPLLLDEKLTKIIIKEVNNINKRKFFDITSMLNLIRY